MRRVGVQIPEPRFSLDAMFTPVARPSPQRSLTDTKADRLKFSQPDSAPHQHH